MTNLKDKIVFITGASSGIGKSCAYAFAEHGSKLVLNARTREKLEQLKKDLEEKYKGIQIYLLDFDVRDREKVVSAINSLPAEFSEVDVLVNSAGLGRGRDQFHECDIDDWDVMIDTNIKGLLYVTHTISQGMVQRKHGSIINIGSVAGKEVYPRGNVYCATKWAVRALSTSMRIDFVEYGIRVTDIEPAKVKTNFEENRFKGKDTSRQDNYEDYTPLNPDDIADAVVFAASRPDHVQITELSINPTDQASAAIINRRK